MSRNPGSLAELAPVAIQCMSVHDPAFIRRSSVGQASLFSTHQQFVACSGVKRGATLPCGPWSNPPATAGTCVSK